MKSFIVSCLAALAAYAVAVPAFSADTPTAVIRSAPKPATVECAAAWQQARAGVTGQPSIVYSACPDLVKFSRSPAGVRPKSGQL
jgi:hypothetical protein